MIQFLTNLQEFKDLEVSFVMIGVLVYLLLQVMKEFKTALREHSKVLTKIEVTLAQQCETLRVLNDAFMVYVKAEKWGLQHNKREERR